MVDRVVTVARFEAAVVSIDALSVTDSVLSTT